MAGTLAEKVWENHIVRRGTDGALQRAQQLAAHILGRRAVLDLDDRAVEVRRALRGGHAAYTIARPARLVESRVADVGAAG